MHNRQPEKNEVYCSHNTASRLPWSASQICRPLPRTVDGTIAPAEADLGGSRKALNWVIACFQSHQDHGWRASEAYRRDPGYGIPNHRSKVWSYEQQFSTLFYRSTDRCRHFFQNSKKGVEEQLGRGVRKGSPNFVAVPDFTWFIIWAKRKGGTRTIYEKEAGGTCRANHLTSHCHQTRSVQSLKRRVGVLM